MSVLILGATSPIARAIANEYAKAGHSIYAAARNAREAEDVAADIAVRFQVETAGGAFEATDFEHHGEFLERVEDEVGDVTVAVLAFGVMGRGPEEGDFADAHKVIDVNYTGAVSVCEALADRLCARSAGSIIGISSVAGDRGRQSNYIYGSAKGALTLYLQGLRNRCFKGGVHVMTVKLGFVDTRMTYGMETAIPIASPESVGRAVYKAQQRGENSLYYPRFWRGIMTIIKAIPEALFKRLSL